MIKFLLDDMRDLNCDIICRSYDMAMLVKDNFNWSEVELLLDHDLADENTPERTGLTFLRTLLQEEQMPAKIYIVTSNPVGHRNIIAELEADGWYEPVDYQKREWRCTFYDTLDSELFEVDSEE